MDTAIDKAALPDEAVGHALISRLHCFLNALVHLVVDRNDPSSPAFRLSRRRPQFSFCLVEHRRHVVSGNAFIRRISTEENRRREPQKVTLYAGRYSLANYRIKGASRPALSVNRQNASIWVNCPLASPVDVLHF